MNNKGQALVEFILILPIFILILFAIVDFGMIINAKSSLENKSIDVINHIKNNKTINEIESLYADIEIEVQEENDYLKITLSDKIDIITPGLNRIFDDPYVATIERYIYND